MLVADHKDKSGPVSTAQLQALATSGQLQQADMVWKEGMAQWVPASTITELFTYLREAAMVEIGFILD